MCAQSEGTAPPGGTGLHRRALRRVWEPLAGRYYQLLSGHAAIGSFLHDRMTGSQRLESDECWWYNCGKRQTRHRLFTERRAWAPRIRRLFVFVLILVFVTRYIGPEGFFYLTFSVEESWQGLPVGVSKAP